MGKFSLSKGRFSPPAWGSLAGGVCATKIWKIARALCWRPRSVPRAQSNQNQDQVITKNKIRNGRHFFQKIKAYQQTIRHHLSPICFISRTLHFTYRFALLFVLVTRRCQSKVIERRLVIELIETNRK